MIYIVSVPHVIYPPRVSHGKNEAGIEPAHSGSAIRRVAGLPLVRSRLWGSNPLPSGFLGNGYIDDGELRAKCETQRRFTTASICHGVLHSIQAGRNTLTAQAARIIFINLKIFITFHPLPSLRIKVPLLLYDKNKYQLPFPNHLHMHSRDM